MNASLINLAYQPTLSGFDDRPLRALLESKCEVEVNEYFFVVGGVPHMTCFVKWSEGEARPKSSSQTPKARPASAPAHSRAPTQPRAPAERRDPRAELSPAQAKAYESLRAWRMTKAEAAGVPAFRVLSNRQLAAIVRERPRDTEALARLPGIGATRAENYGAEVLALLAAG